MTETPIPPPLPCPACGLLKDGDGLLCAYCARAAAELERQIQEDNRGR